MARFSLRILVLPSVIAASFVAWNMFGNTGTTRDTLLVIADSTLFEQRRVWSQDRLLISVPVKNAGHSPLKVAFSSTCSCTSLEPRETVIPPNTTQTVRLTVDTRPQSIAQMREGRWSSTIPLIAHYRSDALQKRTQWTLPLSIHSVWQSVPSFWEFPQHFVCSAPNASIRVCVIETHLPLASLVTKASSAWLVTRCKPIDDRHWELSIGTTDQCPQGPVSETLWLLPRPRNGQHPPAWQVELRGQIRPDIRSHPRELDFGVIQTDDTLSQRLVISSQSERPFSLEVSKESPAALDITIVHATRSVKTVDVTLHPTTTDEPVTRLDGVLRFRASYDTLDSPPLEVNVPFSGYQVGGTVIHPRDSHPTVARGSE